jgi:hypothetical protein
MARKTLGAHSAAGSRPVAGSRAMRPGELCGLAVSGLAAQGAQHVVAALADQPP